MSKYLKDLKQTWKPVWSGFTHVIGDVLALDPKRLFGSVWHLIGAVVVSTVKTVFFSVKLACRMY